MTQAPDPYRKVSNTGKAVILTVPWPAGPATMPKVGTATAPPLSGSAVTTACASRGPGSAGHSGADSMYRAAAADPAHCRIIGIPAMHKTRFLPARHWTMSSRGICQPGKRISGRRRPRCDPRPR